MNDYWIKRWHLSHFCKNCVISQALIHFLSSCFHRDNFATLMFFKIKFVLCFVTMLSKLISWWIIINCNFLFCCPSELLTFLLFLLPKIFLCNLPHAFFINKSRWTLFQGICFTGSRQPRHEWHTHQYMDAEYLDMCVHGMLAWSTQHHLFFFNHLLVWFLDLVVH